MNLSVIYGEKIKKWTFSVFLCVNRLYTLNYYYKYIIYLYFLIKIILFQILFLGIIELLNSFPEGHKE